jgi:hypothetical protein
VSRKFEIDGCLAGDALAGRLQMIFDLLRDPLLGRLFLRGGSIVSLDFREARLFRRAAARIAFCFSAMSRAIFARRSISNFAVASRAAFWRAACWSSSTCRAWRSSSAFVCTAAAACLSASICARRACSAAAATD